MPKRVLALALLSAAVQACGDKPSAPPSYPPSSSPAGGADPANTAVSSTATSGSSSGSASITTPTGSPGCGKAAKPGAVSQKVPIMGKSRAYTLVVPDGYSASTPYPIVFVLHGSGGSGAAARSQFDLERIAKGQALFLYPDGASGNWDLDSPASKNADVALFDALLAITQSSLCVDLHRVFVTGFSNGAYMANQLGCRRGDRIRAVASHAGGGPYENAGTYDEQGHLVCPGKSVASLVVHGLADKTVAPSEGDKSIEHWSFADRCDGGARPWTMQRCVAQQGCLLPVVACKVPGLGHSLWPEGRQATWAFFDALK